MLELEANLVSPPITRPTRSEPLPRLPRKRPRRDGSPDGRKRLGPHSALIDRGALGGAIPGNSREGRFLRAYEAMLVEHLGSPSILQKAMIARASRVALHLELLDESVFCEGKALSQHAYQHYCAWSNSLVRTLQALGLKPGKQPNGGSSPRLSDYLGDTKRPVGRPRKVSP
jgi:hypothetical protein